MVTNRFFYKFYRLNALKLFPIYLRKMLAKLFQNIFISGNVSQVFPLIGVIPMKQNEYEIFDPATGKNIL